MRLGKRGNSSVKLAEKEVHSRVVQLVADKLHLNECDKKYGGSYYTSDSVEKNKNAVFVFGANLVYW